MPFPSTRNALYLLFFPALTVAGPVIMADAAVGVSAGMDRYCCSRGHSWSLRDIAAVGIAAVAAGA